MNLTIKPYLRPWVMGGLTAIAAAIGWEPTVKAVKVAIEYAQTHPLPEAPVPTNAPPVVVVTNATPPAVTNAPPAPAKSKNFRPLRGTYVQWDNCPRDGWPEKDNGKTVNGILYGCLVGGAPKKIEWIPRGRENTGYQNALAGPGSKYGQAGWAKGARVLFQIRDINGKLRDPTYQGEMTLP